MKINALGILSMTHFIHLAIKMHSKVHSTEAVGRKNTGSKNLVGKGTY
jgi:hypothetical protein